MGTLGRRRWCWQVAWALLLAAPVVGRTVGEVTNPRQANGGWVTDHANVIDSAAELRINATVDALRATSGAEVAVVTVEDTSGEDTKQFATALFNTWKIGQAGQDSGVLVLLNMGERRIEIETGYGVEAVLTDSRVGRILDDRIIPAFKRGEFGAGLEAGVDAIAGAIGQTAEFAPGGGTPTPLSSSPTPLRSPDTGAPPMLFYLFTGLMGAGGAGLWYAKRRAIPVCASCDQRMTHLDDDEEDEFLDPLQKLEETVGGVDYHVWQCPTCNKILLRQQRRDQRVIECPACARLTLKSSEPAKGIREQACQNPACNHRRTLRLLNEGAEDLHLDDLQQLEESLGGLDYDVWVCDETNEVVVETKLRHTSRIDDCPACGRRTMRHTEHLVRAATRWHDGLRRHEYQCLNPACGRVHTREESIPRIVETSSSSWSSGGSSFGGGGGGGSSFGGGSSGGGGAGRSF